MEKIVKIFNVASIQLINLFYIMSAEAFPLTKPPVWVLFRLDRVMVVLRKCVIIVMQNRLKKEKKRVI